MKQSNSKYAIFVFLGFSVLLNIATLSAVVALNSIYQARLEAMQATFLRCSIGIRWVERVGDKGKIIVVEKEMYNRLRSQLQKELSDAHQ